MKSKLLKFALISFLIFLPLPFVFEWSMFFGGVYIAFGLIVSGATWGQLNKHPSNAN